MKSFLEVPLGPASEQNAFIDEHLNIKDSQLWDGRTIELKWPKLLSFMRAKHTEGNVTSSYISRFDLPDRKAIAISLFSQCVAIELLEDHSLEATTLREWVSQDEEDVIAFLKTQLNKK